MNPKFIPFRTNKPFRLASALVLMATGAFWIGKTTVQEPRFPIVLLLAALCLGVGGILYGLAFCQE